MPTARLAGVTKTARNLRSAKDASGTTSDIACPKTRPSTLLVASGNVTNSNSAGASELRNTVMGAFVATCFGNDNHSSRKFSDLLLSERGAELDWRHPADSRAVQAIEIHFGGMAGGG